MCVNCLLAHHVGNLKFGVRQDSRQRTAARWIWGFPGPDLETLLQIVRAHQSLSTPSLSSKQQR